MLHRIDDVGQCPGSRAGDLARTAAADRAFGAASDADVARAHHHDFGAFVRPRGDVPRAADRNCRLGGFQAFGADVARAARLHGNRIDAALADVDVAGTE